MKTTRILVCDDHEELCLRIGEWLSTTLTPQYEVEHETAPMLALNRVRRDAYDLLITDFEMPGLNGLELAKAVKESNPETRVILLTMHDKNMFDWKHLSDIVEGFVSKKDIYTLLPTTIKDILDGKHPELQRESKVSPLLTHQEKSVYDLMSNDLTHEEISLQLGLSEKALSAHIKNIKRKIQT
jgi:DNA-binding NarL/FixJ family response regulator